MTVWSPFLSLPSLTLFTPGLGLIPDPMPLYSTFVQLTLTDVVVCSALGHVSNNHLSASGFVIQDERTEGLLESPFPDSLQFPQKTCFLPFRVSAGRSSVSLKPSYSLWKTHMLDRKEQLKGITRSWSAGAGLATRRGKLSCAPGVTACRILAVASLCQQPSSSCAHVFLCFLFFLKVRLDSSLQGETGLYICFLETRLFPVEPSWKERQNKM